MIACLTVPYFASAVERRYHQTIKTEPQGLLAERDRPGLVIGGQPWESQAVYAYSHEVAKQGVKPGMSLRLAHFLSPQAQFLPANQPRYLDASAEVVDLLAGFTHLVEPELFWSQAGSLAQNNKISLQAGYGPAFGYRLPARYTLDLESLPLRESLDLVKEMGRTIRRKTKLAPAIGLAENNFVAHIAAVLTEANHARPVMPEEVAPFLTARSIRFLNLEKETARRLSLLGIRTLGQLVTLPFSSAVSHLALDEPSRKALKALHHLIKTDGYADLKAATLSNLTPPLQPRSPIKEEQLSYHFDPPVADHQVLERVLIQAAARLADLLHKAGSECRTLQLLLQADENIFQGDGGGDLANGSVISKRALSRRQPTADPNQIVYSLRELLHQALTTRRSSNSSSQLHLAHQHNSVVDEGSLKFDVGLTALTIKISDLSPAETGQLSLFDPSREHGQLQNILTNLRGKYEAGIFLKPDLTDPHHPLLERRFELRELVVV